MWVFCGVLKGHYWFGFSGVVQEDYYLENQRLSNLNIEPREA